MSTSRSVTAILRAQDNGYTSTINRASSLLRRLSGNTKEASSSNQSFGGVLKGMVGALGIAKVAGMAYSTAMSNVSSAMSRQDTLYLYERNLKSAGIASEIVAANLTELKDAVQDTAYGTDAAANSVQAFVNANMSLDKSTAVTKRFMDLNSRFGDGTNETYKRIMFQMNQMGTKGKASIENINTAVESGIPVWQILSSQTGKSVQEMQTAVSKGEVSAEEFFDLLIAGSEEAAGSAKDGANTWAGSIGIMKSRIALGVDSILTSFKSIATTLTGDEFGIFTAVTWVGTFIKNGFTKIGEFIQAGFEFAYPYIIRFKNMFSRIREPVENALNAVKTSLQELWGQFDKTGSLDSFQSILDKVANSIQRFSGFVEKNSDSIAKMIAIIPKLVGALTALNIVKSVGQKFAGFGADVLYVAGNMSQLNQNIGGQLLGSISIMGSKFTGFFGTFKQGLSSFVSGVSTFVLKNREILNATKILHGTGNFGWFQSFSRSVMAFVPESRNFISGMNMMGRSVSSFAQKLVSPITNLKNLGSLVNQAGGTLPFFANGIKSAAVGIGTAFKSLATTGIGAIKSLSAAMLSNPITAVLLALAVGVAGFATAWQSNFMNVQGYTKSVFSGVGQSLSSLGGMFDGILPKGIDMGEVMKEIGVIFAKILGVAIGVVVDAFRLLVASVAIVIKGFMALGNSAKMVGKALTGDFKGAGEAFNDVKDNISSMGDTMDNFVQNSATKKAIESFSELKDVSGETAKKMELDYQNLGQATTDFANKASENFSRVKEAFKFEEGAEDNLSTARMSEYFDNSLELLGNYQENKQSMIESSNDIIQSAQEGSEQEKIQAQIRAAETILNNTSSSNQAVFSLYQEHSQMLKTNKTIEGQELTEEQRKALQEQTDIIRQELIAQNQLYVDAGLQKIQNGAKLDEQEQQTVISNLQALYANKSEEITSNEAKIAELKNQYEQAQTESEKLNYKAQYEALELNNNKIRQEYSTNGEAILQVLLNGNEAKASTVLQGLQSMNDITDQQLTDLFTSFVSNNQDTDQQLALLAGIMQQRGVEGATNLVTGLQSGDTKMIGTSITADVQAGLSTLPEGMFTNGTTGRDQFIQALKNGDTVGAGKTLVDGTVTGANAQIGKIGEAGSESGKEYSSKVDSRKSDAEKSGKNVAESATKGMKQEQSNQKEAGRVSGEKYSEGVRSQKTNANNAGKEIGSAAKSGAGSIDFQPVGYNMAGGVASGIIEGTPDAVGAMRSLVEQINAEAKKKAEIKSPSRLLKREVGFQLPAGIAGGIAEKGYLAVNAVREVVSNVYSAATEGAQNISFLSGDSLRVTHEAVNNSDTNFLSSILDKLDDLSEQRMSVYLDTGALVGGTANSMDSELGKKAKRGRRNSLW